MRWGCGGNLDGAEATKRLTALPQAKSDQHALSSFSSDLLGIGTAAPGSGVAGASHLAHVDALSYVTGVLGAFLAFQASRVQFVFDDEALEVRRWELGLGSP